MIDLTTTLVGRDVTLTPLAIEDAPTLVACASIDRSSYGFTTVPDDERTMREHIASLLAAQELGEDVAFTTRRGDDGLAVGMTRFLNLRWWFGRDVPDAVEIGGTFLAASAQRTSVNTEAKYLMLRHAFDVWHVRRVDFKTDARNERSRRALERLGARFEGVQRCAHPSGAPGEEGRMRDSAYYAVTVDEWPAVRAVLEARLGYAS